MRFLIVEDEPKVASFIRRALEEESYAVDVCSDGLKGLDLACEVDYDLVILDLMLPGLPGLEVLKKLRAAKVKNPRSHSDRTFRSRPTRQRVGHGC